ncbi:MAG: transmembrane domain-containing protein [Gammaproteobacteria bacterium]|nr:transmembrane domain-containing protein [Gammaproteobacteria bacterium]MCH9793704.1 transmembrane domain-containing protein [Planctomycetota bacterium]
MTKYSTISGKDGVNYENLLSRLQKSRDPASAQTAPTSTDKLAVVYQHKYVIGGVAVLALVGAGWLWRRSRRQKAFPASFAAPQRNEAPDDDVTHIDDGTRTDDLQREVATPVAKKNLWIHICITVCVLGCSLYIWFKFCKKNSEEQKSPREIR